MYINDLMVVTRHKILAEYHQETRKNYEIYVPGIDELAARLLESCLSAACFARYDKGLDIIFAGALQPDAIPFLDALAALRASGRAIRSAVWLVGPEGDFSPDEYDALRAAGVAFVSLGDLVLRTETAAIYGLCVLGAEFLVRKPDP